jgi:hypothetical protein
MATTACTQLKRTIHLSLGRIVTRMARASAVSVGSWRLWFELGKLNSEAVSST